jgi:hypothetical protein
MSVVTDDKAVSMMQIVFQGERVDTRSVAGAPAGERAR